MDENATLRCRSKRVRLDGLLAKAIAELAQHNGKEEALPNTKRENMG
jgi:hypothetical protein